MALVRAAQGTSADSNTCGGYRYDVFLSFRGEDTRKTFTDHLYTALNNAGFLTFRDDDELERGEDIKPGLQKAIQLSRASVVVFSKDYASSRWCLDELVLILERKRTTSDHVVLPVFYDVDPSHVRKQTGSIGKAFARHQKNQSLKKVKGWREALAKVADLAGMVLQNQADGYESKFIEKIVKVIGDKLSRTPLSIEPKLIGIKSQVERINLWLQDGSNDVGIFIVYGMSGIGKTTIAKHVYNSNFRSFEGSSFIENIKEIATRPNGLVQIQMQLLSNILNGREVKIHSVSEGIIKIEGAISSRKVLLVLDDVDHMDQLDAVLKMKDRFYPGSKILITTRRERLLKAHQVTKVHRVETLDYNESLELFSWHAFGQDHPTEEYMEHSKMVVQHSGGLPLALRVLGSTLSGESIDVWESALEKLKVIPNGEILNKLRISYDSLQDDHDQKLFLHIACFLIGRDKNYIVRILNGCDFFTTIGIHNLIDRCLVTIDKYDKVNMHDMIRDMGREIVRLESEEPEKRSRLWRHKDSFEVLRDKNVLPLLKILDFSHSHDLTEIMDFSLCPSLEELILVDCTSLKSVHESIGNLERLVYLNMKDCKNLRMLPKNMCMLKSLETLILSGCSSLDEFPVEMMKQIESLKVLKTDGIPLNELWPERSSSILSSFPCSLVELNLSRCNLSDDAFPWDLSNLSSIRRLYLDENPICSLPIFIKGLRRLDHLSFYDCERLKSLVGLPKGHQCLYVSQCKSLEKVSYLQDHFFNWSPEFHSIGGSIDNLVEWQYWYKLEPIGRVDVEVIKLLGLCNLESLPNIRMHKFGRMVWCDDWSPVQGLHQYGIFSTFLPGNEFFPRNEVPSRLIHKSGGSSSISFTVPLLPNHRGRGLNVFAVYENVIDFSDTELVYDCMDIRMTIKVSNKSKGLKWIYVPLVYGIPGEGEDMTWLSHWKMENETIALECGDEVSVSVLMRHPWFQLKEFGVELVQEHQNNTMISTQHNTKSDPNYPFVISGDLSMWEHIPGIYFLGGFSKEYIKSMPRSNWINHLIMDSDEEDTDKEEGQEDEPYYTIAMTRAASNNYGLGGWKVLLIVVGFFFTLALVLWSSISQKKK
ncbi:disease resistance protein RUN1 isoform X2 [Pyrus x bretschneideri]|uniref:disease resistance protein RUN1 isoform X2 n=1 Tax=Pyrus x bretschneideri TaxID=225117 RepID=UPI00202F6D8F|nr:disease resistance protein RUN1 isoform X2 [Pyrus x bretschneideri]